MRHRYQEFSADPFLPTSPSSPLHAALWHEATEDLCLDPNSMASSINNSNPPIIVGFAGTDYTTAVMWPFVDTDFVQRDLGAWDPATKARKKVYGYASKINDRCEIIGDFTDATTYNHLGTFWQNGTPVSLDTRISSTDFNDFYPYDLNNKGAMLAYATKTSDNTDTNVLLIPVQYQELYPSSGFDGVSNPPWLMVPVGGTNQANVLLPTSTTPFNLSVQTTPPGPTTNTVLPTTTSISSQTMTVTSGGFVGDYAAVQVGLGSVQPTKVDKSGLGLDFKPMKYVNVAIHRVTQHYTDDDPPDIAPGSTPSNAELQTYLNQVFGTQANVYFIVWSDDFTVDYDLNQNGALDLTVGSNGRSPEEQVLASHVDPAALNVYYVHAFTGYGSNATGVSKYLLQIAYIADQPNIVNTTAHEIGHLLDLAHPQWPWLPDGISDNPAYLKTIPDPKVSDRLMTMSSTVSETPTLLIKPEWDIINHNVSSP